MLVEIIRREAYTSQACNAGDGSVGTNMLTLNADDNVLATFALELDTSNFAQPHHHNHGLNMIGWDSALCDSAGAQAFW